MIFRRGIPFPVQSDTKVRREINPIERVEGTQSLPHEVTFDYERKLAAERSDLHVDVREPDIIINPQPKTEPLIGVAQKMGVIAERPILKKLVADHLDFEERFKSQRFIASKNYVEESIPPHQPSFTKVAIPERKTEYPKDEQDWAKRESWNFLDKFFHWLNSVIGE